jgi:hypothetical protein
VVESVTGLGGTPGSSQGGGGWVGRLWAGRVCAGRVCAGSCKSKGT